MIWLCSFAAFCAGYLMAFAAARIEVGKVKPDPENSRGPAVLTAEDAARRVP